MFRRSDSVPATDPQLPVTGDVPLDQPHDTCFKCGRPTPPGVSLCDRDNPGKIKSPSSTQVHGTILIGVIGGFLALLVLFRVASAGFGPFTATVAGAATRADGGLDVVISVANGGTRDSGASCRISPGGALTYTDFVFFTAPIPAGETRQFAKSLAPPADGSALPDANVLVRCT